MNVSACQNSCFATLKFRSEPFPRDVCLPSVWVYQHKLHKLDEHAQENDIGRMF